MGYSEILAPYNNHIRNLVVQETWGHLAPKQRTEYSGFILFAFTAWGKMEPIEAEFKGLEMSPWLFQEINEFIGNQYDRRKFKGEFNVLRFDGSVMVLKNGNYRFSGKVRKISTN